MEDTNLETAKSGVPIGLEQAVGETQILLAYAAHKGLDIPEDKISILISAKNKIKNGILPQTIEAKFWSAYTEITTKIQPVTVSSIKATSDMFGEKVRTFSFWRGPRQMSMARKAVMTYQRRFFQFLFLLLVLQTYAGFGSSVISGIDQLDKQILENELLQGNLKQEQSRETDEAKKKQLTERLARLQDNLNLWRYNIQAQYELLRFWNLFKFLGAKALSQNKTTSLKSAFGSLSEKSVQEKSGNQSGAEKTENGQVPSPKPEPAAGSSLEDLITQGSKIDLREQVAPVKAGGEAEQKIKTIDDRFRILQAGRIMLRSLNEYFLPLLYGVLGALAYVLRTLSFEIETYVYSPESDIRFQLKLYLGALAGFAIAWFLNPKTSPGILESIAPFALAFLAGYSVELVFSAMDSMISAFSLNKRGQKA